MRPICALSSLPFSPRVNSWLPNVGATAMQISPLEQREGYEPSTGGCRERHGGEYDPVFRSGPACAPRLARAFQPRDRRLRPKQDRRPRTRVTGGAVAPGGDLIEHLRGGAVRRLDGRGGILGARRHAAREALRFADAAAAAIDELGRYDECHASRRAGRIVVELFQPRTQDYVAAHARRGERCAEPPAQ